MHTLRLVLVFFMFFGLKSLVSGQDVNLATQYFANGEFEKAAAIYAQLVEKDGRNDYYFNRYFDCLLNLEQYEEGEKAIKKQIKKTPSNALNYVLYGTLFDRQGKTAEASAQWQKALDNLAPDLNGISRVANQFTQMAKFDEAIAAFERGGQLLREPNIFALNLGELYRRKGNTPKMIESFLNALDGDPGKTQNVQFYLSRYLSETDFEMLETELYNRIQVAETPDYIELLAWAFIQRKDFKNALRQLKALDKRLEENGNRIFRLATDASNAKDYDAAIAAYDYIVQEKGQLNQFFYESKQGSLNCRRRKLTDGYAYTKTELTILETDYESFLLQYGKNRQTASLILELAELEALYINNLGKAITILDELTKVPGIDRNTQARAKINLADTYLMLGERWESTLLYSQVDKEFKEEQLGQEARFKNAKLAYYNGDFQWAQAQFDVLKASTSKLIANDALDLSVFIMDNLNLDTTADAITLYAGAELLVFQNRFDEAFARLDTLRRNFPEHSLQDDILYLEAQIYEKKREYAKAIDLYKQVAEKYNEDIRADNALFAMANLYETRLNDPEQAKTLFEKIFMDYSGSVFAVDARKRFRVLRGDKVQ